jgi:hypothetical protein
MFILLDKPYISQLLIDTINDNNFAAYDTGNVLQNGEVDLVNKSDIVNTFETVPDSKIYTTSESSIEWIDKHLPFTDLAQKAKLFKDKTAFRDLTKDMFPDLYYREVKFDEIEELDISDIPKPFIIKPSVGFFSLGVYKVFDQSGWDQTKRDIILNTDKIKDLYPDEVLRTSKFIIEQEIRGDEFAVDAYYDDRGTPHILGIMQHYFASESDVSDRVYMASKEIIRKNIHRFDEFLNRLGERVSLKNFPLHVEVRIDEDQKLLPIEVNPLRFGGWCTSAELAYHAFNVNSYANFMTGKKPDWESILSRKDDHVWCLIILDNSTGHDGKDIESFDFDKLASEFTNVLEVRKSDHEAYPIFGFLYVKVRADEMSPVDKILKSDLREYITLKKA